MVGFEPTPTSTAAPSYTTFYLAMVGFEPTPTSTAAPSNTTFYLAMVGFEPTPTSTAAPIYSIIEIKSLLYLHVLKSDPSILDF